MLDHAKILERAKDLIRPYDTDLAAGHKAFVLRNFGNRRKVFTEAWLRYVFGAPREGPVDDLLIAVKDGEVVGQMGFLPATLEYGGRTWDAQWACKLMVDPHSRGLGLAKMLFAVGASRRWMTLGSDPTPGSDAVQQRLGFIPLVGPKKMVFPLRPQHVLGWKLSPEKRALFAGASLLAEPLCSVLSHRLRRRAGTDVRVVPWEQLLDRLKARPSGGLPRVVHDRAFMLQHFRPRPPGFEVHAPLGIEAKDGAFAVIHLTPPLCYVYEWFAPSLHSTQRLFARIHTVARRVKGCQTLSALAQSARESKWLGSLCFLPLRTRVMLRYFAPDRPIPEGTRLQYHLYDSDGNL